jgi:hypothetical protein
VQESIASDSEVHEDGLDAGFDVDDDSFVNVSDEVVLRGSLDVKFFQSAIFEYGDSALFGLPTVDDHFLFHYVLLSFWDKQNPSEDRNLKIAALSRYSVKMSGE